MKKLSSTYTFFYKYIFIFVWIGGFGIGAGKELFFPPFDARWMQFFLIWVAVSACIYFTSGAIKQVEIDLTKKIFRVSNFIKTTDIHFADIEDIDGSSLLSPRLVWFTLKKDSVFGRKISFMPVNRPSAKSIGKHPLVMELRKELKMDVVL